MIRAMCIAAYLAAGCTTARDAPATASTDSGAVKLSNPHCLFYCTNTANLNNVDAQSGTADAPRASKDGEFDPTVKPAIGGHDRIKPAPKRAIPKQAR